MQRLTSADGSLGDKCLMRPFLGTLLTSEEWARRVEAENTNRLLRESDHLKQEQERNDKRWWLRPSSSMETQPRVSRKPPKPLEQQVGEDDQAYLSRLKFDD